MNLRCRPGDLAVVIQAHLPSNLGRIVKILKAHDGEGEVSFPPTEFAWYVTSPYRMSWTVNGKRYRRKKGPIPDRQLQPIKGVPLDKTIFKDLEFDAEFGEVL